MLKSASDKSYKKVIDLAEEKPGMVQRRQERSDRVKAIIDQGIGERKAETFTERELEEKRVRRDFLWSRVRFHVHLSGMVSALRAVVDEKERTCVEYAVGAKFERNMGFTYRFDLDLGCLMILKPEYMSMCEQNGWKTFWNLRKIQGLPIRDPEEGQCVFLIQVMLPFFVTCGIHHMVTASNDQDMFARAKRREEREAAKEQVPRKISPFQRTFI